MWLTRRRKRNRYFVLLHEECICLAKNGTWESHSHSEFCVLSRVDTQVVCSLSIGSRRVEPKNLRLETRWNRMQFACNVERLTVLCQCKIHSLGIPFKIERYKARPVIPSPRTPRIYYTREPEESKTRQHINPQHKRIPDPSQFVKSKLIVVVRQSGQRHVMSGCCVSHFLVLTKVTRVLLVSDEPLQSLAEHVEKLLGTERAEIGGPVL